MGRSAKIAAESITTIRLLVDGDLGRLMTQRHCLLRAISMQSTLNFLQRTREDRGWGPNAETSCSDLGHWPIKSDKRSPHWVRAIMRARGLPGKEGLAGTSCEGPQSWESEE